MTEEIQRGKRFDIGFKLMPYTQKHGCLDNCGFFCVCTHCPHANAILGTKTLTKTELFGKHLPEGRSSLTLTYV